MKTRLPILLAAVALYCPAAFAALSSRTGTIDQIQFDNHTRVGYEDAVWVYMPGTWPGVTCGADWAWFNGKENPQFVATVLTARATGAQLKVYVDDAAPKINGVACQVMVVMY